MHYWKSRLCREPETLGKGQQTVSKGFADGPARHRPHGEFFLGHGSLPSTRDRGSRHRLCREPSVGHRPVTSLELGLIAKWEISKT
jgi:hypothetical protein